MRQVARADEVDTDRTVVEAGLFDLAREVVYAPIAGRSLVDATAKRLLSVISTGLVAVGDQLPSEPDLAYRLGVSPATLREALAQLRGAGLLKTKRGRGGGSVVVESPLPPAPEQARQRLAALSFDDVRDLGEYHSAIFGRAAVLAAKRATPSELTILQSLSNAMTGHHDAATFSRVDAQLHIGIASSARSSRLIAGETTVQAELGDFASLLATPTSRLALARDQHHEIIAAITARDTTHASQAAQTHAQTIASLLTETRSEIAPGAPHHPDNAFAGLKPYGSELGSTPLQFAYDPIKAVRPPPTPTEPHPTSGAKRDGRRRQAPGAAANSGS